ncbi:uncharacterized protein STEHIDRAFT_162165 [Stereum hirsutum FP-91666 SS1]|uniref:uncharacterized protein n=1 Tax=Stereum hirsutum (strain FP-91666) TaxID=721885 RepID=UPI0004449E71|nr:uncharacterized protein STEHIDRAFT_162165 [Stereum hirsutum FP-91666 SS1]EIM81176.1 hypothetical protein STEHIDRAFT_162165 [Stereum hirsutum FP-91666 SS1]
MHPVKRRRLDGLNNRYDNMIDQVHLMSRGPIAKPRHRPSHSSGSSSISSHDMPHTPLDAYTSALTEGRLGKDFSVLKMKDASSSNHRSSSPNSDLVEPEPPRPVEPLPSWLNGALSGLDSRHPLRNLVSLSNSAPHNFETRPIKGNTNVPTSRTEDPDNVFSFHPPSSDSVPPAELPDTSLIESNDLSPLNTSVYAPHMTHHASDDDRPASYSSTKDSFIPPDHIYAPAFTHQVAPNDLYALSSPLLAPPALAPTPSLVMHLNNSHALLSPSNLSPHEPIPFSRPGPARNVSFSRQITAVSPPSWKNAPAYQTSSSRSALSLPFNNRNSQAHTIAFGSSTLGSFISSRPSRRSAITSPSDLSPEAAQLAERHDTVSPPISASSSASGDPASHKALTKSRPLLTIRHPGSSPIISSNEHASGPSSSTTAATLIPMEVDVDGPSRPSNFHDPDDTLLNHDVHIESPYNTPSSSSLSSPPAPAFALAPAPAPAPFSLPGPTFSTFSFSRKAPPPIYFSSPTEDPSSDFDIPHDAVDVGEESYSSPFLSEAEMEGKGEVRGRVEDDRKMDGDGVGNMEGGSAGERNMDVDETSDGGLDVDVDYETLGFRWEPFVRDGRSHSNAGADSKSTVVRPSNPLAGPAWFNSRRSNSQSQKPAPPYSNINFNAFTPIPEDSVLEFEDDEAYSLPSTLVRRSRSTDPDFPTDHEPPPPFIQHNNDEQSQSIPPSRSPTPYPSWEVPAPRRPTVSHSNSNSNQRHEDNAQRPSGEEAGSNMDIDVENQMDFEVEEDASKAFAPAPGIYVSPLRKNNERSEGSDESQGSGEIPRVVGARGEESWRESRSGMVEREKEGGQMDMDVAEHSDVTKLKVEGEDRGEERHDYTRSFDNKGKVGENGMPCRESKFAEHTLVTARPHTIDHRPSMQVRPGNDPRLRHQLAPPDAKVQIPSPHHGAAIYRPSESPDDHGPLMSFGVPRPSVSSTTLPHTPPRKNRPSTPSVHSISPPPPQRIINGLDSARNSTGSKSALSREGGATPGRQSGGGEDAQPDSQISNSTLVPTDDIYRVPQTPPRRTSTAMDLSFPTQTNGSTQDVPSNYPHTNGTPHSVEPFARSSITTDVQAPPPVTPPLRKPRDVDAIMEEIGISINSVQLDSARHRDRNAAFITPIGISSQLRVRPNAQPERTQVRTATPIPSRLTEMMMAAITTTRDRNKVQVQGWKPVSSLRAPLPPLPSPTGLRQQRMSTLSSLSGPKAYTSSGNGQEAGQGEVHSAASSANDDVEMMQSTADPSRTHSITGTEEMGSEHDSIESWG